MSSIDKQWRKISFRDSRKLILADKLGFFWKILIFVIAMIAVNIIAVFIGIEVNKLLGLIFSVFIGVMVSTLFNKFLVTSEKEGLSINIHRSNIRTKVYINCLIWQIIKKCLIFIPIILFANEIMSKLQVVIRGNKIYINNIWGMVFGYLSIIIIMNFIIKIFFLSVEYILIEEEINIFNALIKSFKIAKNKILSTAVVIIVVNIQVWLIGIVGFLGYTMSGFGIIKIIAFLFVVVALVGYYKFVEIKWYRALKMFYKKEGSKE